MDSPADKGVRLNRYLASCGVGSRRSCDEFIVQGRVEVNGKVIVDLATRVLPGDHVKFDGKLLKGQAPLTLLLNKPRQYLCTRDDPQGRDTIYKLLPKSFAKLHYVGRLDFESSGLLLLTSSGDLTDRLTHPRYHVEKEYEVHLDRPYDPESTATLLEGIPLTEGLARAEAVEQDGKRRLRIVLTQGYNRQIRRMLAKMGYKVVRLERIRIGSLTAPLLSTGEYHILSPREIEAACTNPVARPRRRNRENRGPGEPPRSGGQ
jgi:23S rRNA pseudouridine2605 synthase